MLERKSQWSWSEVPSPTVYKLCRRDAGGERACVRGVGPRARTALPVVFVRDLRAMLEWDRGRLCGPEEEEMGWRRLGIWKGRGRLDGAI